MVRWYWSADTLFQQLSIDHNIDVQSVFSWALKLARKYVGMSVVRKGGPAYGHVIAKFSRMGRLPHFFIYGALQSARAWRSAKKKTAWKGLLSASEPGVTQG